MVSCGWNILNVKGLSELDRSGPGRDGQSDAIFASGRSTATVQVDAYLRYSALIVPMIKAQRGGTLLWTGNAETVALGEPDAEALGLPRAGLLSEQCGLYRHDDIGRLRDQLRTATAATLRGGDVIIATREARWHPRR